MKKLLSLVILIFFSSCSEAPPNIPKENNVQKEKTEYQRAKSPFWIEARKDENLRFLYDFNTANELYQVELFNDPFKDFVYITLDLSNPDFDLIYYSRFKYRIHKKGEETTIKPPKKVLTIVNPVTKDTIFFIYKKPIQIKRKPKDIAINHFFSKAIWGMSPVEEHFLELDAEKWDVIGRKDGKEIQLRRNSFTDSTYYSNIQHILDICKIKDYSYRKNKPKR